MSVPTLEQFRSTRTRVDDLRNLYICDDYNEPLPGYVYDGDSCYINIDPDGSLRLFIYLNEYTGTLEELEEILYREFYLPEVCGVKE
jgi:hypothetical protein